MEKGNKKKEFGSTGVGGIEEAAPPRKKVDGKIKWGGV